MKFKRSAICTWKLGVLLLTLAAGSGCGTREYAQEAVAPTDHAADNIEVALDFRPPNGTVLAQVLSPDGRSSARLVRTTGGHLLEISDDRGTRTTGEAWPIAYANQGKLLVVCGSKVEPDTGWYVGGIELIDTSSLARTSVRNPTPGFACTPARLTALENGELQYLVGTSSSYRLNLQTLEHESVQDN